MQKKQHPDLVDATTQYWTDVTPAGLMSAVPHEGVFSDSTLMLGAGISARKHVIALLRKLDCTCRVVVQGSFHARAMARSIRDAVKTSNRSFSTLVVVYQITDRAWVSSEGEAVVKTCDRTSWTCDLQLLCEVVRASASKAASIHYVG